MRPDAVTAEKPIVSPNIVRAWFDTALNPLLYGLNMEAAVLQEHNLTWRYQRRLLVSLVPVKAHLVAEDWPNFEQFCSFYPECVAMMDEHDRRLEVLLESCREFESRLLQSREMKETYQRLTARRNPDQLTSIFGACQPENYARVLAEYIINDVQRLPSYYSTAEFWNEHSEEFLSLRESDELKESWRTVAEAAQHFLNAVNRLIAILKEVRGDLSLSAGVPIVDRMPR